MLTWNSRAAFAPIGRINAASQKTPASLLTDAKRVTTLPMMSNVVKAAQMPAIL
jgi:hypothetical protein